MKKIVIILLFSFPALAQIDNQQLGRGMNQTGGYYGNYFDYSDPTTINIKVSIWGYVRSPGKYLVPISSSVKDLLSYAGGPNAEADLDELRLYRVNESGKEELIVFDYTDLYESESLNYSQGRMVNLKAGDYLIVPGSPKYYFRDWLSISLSIFSALVSLTILILNITGN